MTSILSWFPQFWRANLAVGNSIHRLLIWLFVSYILASTACVYLSAWGLPEIIWLIMTLYVATVILIPLHPLVWEALVVGGYVRGQVGGEEGLSVKDGLERIWLWAKALTGQWGKFLLFYGTVPFVWTAINDTEGAVLTHLVLLPLIPPTIYFSVTYWPNSQRIFNTIGLVYVGLVLLAVGVDIYTSIRHYLADPSTKVIMAYERQVKTQELTTDKAVADRIIAKLKRKQKLTKDEVEAWTYLLTKAESQKMKSAIRNLVDQTRDLLRTAPGGIADWWREASPIDEKAAAKLSKEREGHFRREAAKCAEALAELWKAGTPPSAIQEAECRQKQSAANGAASGATSSATATTDWRHKWEGYYDPSKGPMTIEGTWGGGFYCVSGEGIRTQTLPDGTQVRMDWKGELFGQPGKFHHHQLAAGENMPEQAHPYGAVVVKVNGLFWELPTDKGQVRIPGGGRVQLHLNATTLKGDGGFRLRVEECK